MSVCSGFLSHFMNFKIFEIRLNYWNYFERAKCYLRIKFSYSLQELSSWNPVFRTDVIANKFVNTDFWILLRMLESSSPSEFAPYFEVV